MAERKGIYIIDVKINSLHNYGHETPMHHGYSSQHTMEDINEALNIIEDVFRGLDQ